MRRDLTTYLACGILLAAVALLAAPQVSRFLNPIVYYVPPQARPTLAPSPTPRISLVEQASIRNFTFSPSPLTVRMGATVKWTQYDASVPHTVSAGSPTQPDPSSPFNSGTLTVAGMDTYQFTFQEPGIFPYYCTYHTEMVAAVIVTDAQGNVPTSAPPVAAASPTPYNAPPPANAQVIAAGLINPRGFTKGPDGAFYVAEAGTVPETVTASPTISATNPISGTDTLSATATIQPSPAPRGTVNPICESQLPSYDKAKAGCPGAQGPQISNKGRISRIAPDGTRTTLAENLPVTVGPFNDVFGVSSVAFVGDDLYVAIAAGETRGHPDFPTGIYRVTGGVTTLVANLEAFQEANPPKFIPDDYNYSLPYDMASLNGKLYITDGNAAVVYEVDPAQPPGSNVQRIVDLSPTHNVLTGIAASADGALYFTEFTPAPYPVGGAQIFKWTPTESLTTAFTGLSIATGVALAPGSSMYAVEFATDTGKPPFIVPPGRAVRVGANGQLTTVAAPLVYPTAIRWIDGALYVMNDGVNAIDGQPGNGALYRLNVTP